MGITCVDLGVFTTKLLCLEDCMRDQLIPAG